jgi:hypothetical protein
VILWIKMVELYAGSLNPIMLTLPGFCCGFDDFEIRVNALSTISDISLSLLLIGYDVFGVRIISALLVDHRNKTLEQKN